MQAVFTDVANALTAVAAAEDDSSAQLPSPAPAPQRFAAAVQAALASDAQPLQGYAHPCWRCAASPQHLSLPSNWT